MNNAFSYFYNNPIKSAILKQEHLFPGEHILMKVDEIKAEDEKSNIERNCKFYITNYRSIILNDNKVYDIPHCVITSHYIKKPYFGSPYICFYLGSKLPTYVKEFLNISNMTVQYPKYIMIKFKDQTSDLSKPNEMIAYSIKNNEYNTIPIKIKKEEEEKKLKEQNIIKNENTNSTVKMTGLGIERLVNMIDNKNKENNTLIKSSFNDINSLRENVSKLVELGSQLKAKVDTKSEEGNQNEEISQMLQKIGYIDPVTKEIAGKAYIKELSEQLETFFTEYFKTNEGIITIIDAYCIYNRARGINTISPDDMKKAIDFLKEKSSKVFVKYFESSMIMIHSKDYSIDLLYNDRVKNNFLNNNLQSFSVNELCSILKIKNLNLGKLLIDEMIEKGYLCLDESEFDIRVFNNLILLK